MKNNSDIKVLILGADGMAGAIACSFFSGQGYKTYATSRRSNVTSDDSYGYQTLSIDLELNIELLETIIKDHKVDLVINCVGTLNQRAENNKQEAVYINSYLPHYIDRLSLKHAFKLVHISTDCVFSGNAGMYTEDDTPDAYSFYGRSKALGELKNDHSLTLRTSIVGPDKNENGIGLFNWFMRQQDSEITGYDSVIWSGVTTYELARCIELAYKKNMTGLVNLVNNQTISKYDLLTLFKQYSGKKVSIKRDSGFKSDKSLTSASSDVFSIPSYEQMMKSMCEWALEKKIY